MDEARARPDFAALRKEFPTLDRWAYLDIARRAPLPRCAESACQDFFRDIYENAGRTALAHEPVEVTRADLARLLGVPAKTIAFVKNTSEGLNIAVSAIGLRPGDNVLMSELEHEAQVFPLRRLAEQGVELRRVPATEGRVPVAAFMDRMDSRTRAVAASYVAFGNGFRADLPALGRECRQRNVLLISDAIQGLGQLAAPLGTLGADIAVAGCHKALLGPYGTAFLYFGEDLIEGLTPPFIGKHAVTSSRLGDEPLTYPSDARRFEYGNPNFLGLWILRRSLRFIEGIGLQAIEDRVHALTDHLMDRAEKAGLAIRSPRPWNERAGIVCLEVGGAERIVRGLEARGIIASAKDGCVRASVHFYNDESDMERLVTALGV